MSSVTATTLNLFTGTAGNALTFEDVTVLLVRMTSTQVAAWKWVGDAEAGEDPVDGYEVRDREGALLGVILPLGHMASRLHTEWYDPTADDFYAAGETTAAVLTQGIARVLDARHRHAGEVPTGRDLALDPERMPYRHNAACPWLYCFNDECVDHASTWATAA